MAPESHYIKLKLALALEEGAPDRYIDIKEFHSFTTHTLEVSNIWSIMLSNKCTHLNNTTTCDSENRYLLEYNASNNEICDMNGKRPQRVPEMP
jgi:hypothetical protein